MTIFVHLSKIEKLVMELVQAGPVTGMTRDDLFSAQKEKGSEYQATSLATHGIKPLAENGLLVLVGTRHSGNSHFKVWLDSERAKNIGNGPGEAMQHSENQINGAFLEKNLPKASDISVRQALTVYIKDAIIADGGYADPSWIARLIVRDWDIKPR